MRRTSGLATTGIFLLCILSQVACSAFMAGQRSTYKGDPAIIQVGADRMAVESALGAPDMAVSVDNGRTKVVYKIDPDAHSQAGRNAAVAWHLVADVFTLGLWEIVGTPSEMAARDKFTTYLIYYSKEGKIDQVETVK